jgi:hypothetical protein
VLWPEGLMVNITMAHDAASTINLPPLPVPVWKRQEPHNLYALICPTQCASNQGVCWVIWMPNCLFTDLWWCLADR